MEEYKIILKFPRYEVSNLGNVRNAYTKQVLSQRLASNGYLRVNLRLGNEKYEKPKVMSVHRLVAEAFIPIVDDKLYVNHIDGNKQNNNVINLEWCTAQENSIHACNTIVGLKEKYQENIKKAHEKNKKQIVVCLGVHKIGVFESEMEVAKVFHFNEKTIRNGLKNKHKNKEGYSFFYLEEVI